MIHLVYSNSVEELADALAEAIDERRARPGASLFDPTHLVVPTRHVEAFAKLRLAERQGIAFHIETYLLDDLLADLLAASGSNWRLLDLRALRGMLLSALIDGGKGRDDLAPVSDYVHGEGHRDDAAELRKFQLSTELSLVFHDYAWAHPEVLDAWRQGKLGLQGAPPREERWQREVWRLIFAPDGVLARRRQQTGVPWVSALELLDPLSPRSLHHLPLPPHLYFFGLSLGGKFLGRLLGSLAERCEVHVFALNPCAEFWEDMPTVSRRTEQQVEKLAMPVESDTPALRLWGRPGRDAVRVLDELAGFDFDARFRDPAGDALLHRLQGDILLRAPERQGPDPSLRADRSLSVLACPGVRREIEVVASEIWELLRRDPSLRFHEIAVVVSTREASRYLPQIASVFAESGDIPVNILDLPVATDSRIIEAVEMLLALPFGGFGRHELLRLCTHPAVAARFPDDNPEDWIHWSDSLGIVHGADRFDHRDTYITRDMFNWEQGARRLALGAFMTGERSGDSRAFQVGGEAYLPEEHSQAGQLGAGRFGLLIRSLIADARFARQARRTLGDWTRFLLLLVSSYLRPTSEQEEKELVRCLEALQTIDDGSTGDSELSYRLAFQLAMAALGELKATRGQLTHDGVVVAPLHQIQGLPFRVIFVTGLGEGRFPELDRRFALDLRVERPGGELGQRERDKYAFLGALLAARQAFYLSYVSKDLFTQEELQPSSVVLDLIDILKRYLPRDQLDRLVERHPLRRYDAAYFPDIYQLSSEPLPCWQPEARREAQSLELRRHLLAGGRVSADQLRALVHRIPGAWGQIRAHLRLFDLPEIPPTGPRSGPLRLRASSLRRFLECPLQGYAQFALGLFEAEEDALAIEDEPFALPPPRAITHLRAWLAEALVRGVEPVDLYQQQIEVLEHRGKAPTGIFADVERQTHRAWLRGWYAGARSLLGGGVRAEMVRLGSAEDLGFFETSEEPIRVEIDLPTGRVEALISGITNPLLRGRRGSMFFVSRGKEGDDARQEKAMLRGFFDHLLLSAAGRPPAPHAACVVHGDGSTSEVVFKPMTQQQARAFLADLAAELLSRPHSYLLPCEAVFLARDKDLRIEDAVERVRRLPSCSSLYGPIHRLDAFASPPEIEAQAIVERRFGPFFSRIEAEIESNDRSDRPRRKEPAGPPA